MTLNKCKTYIGNPRMQSNPRSILGLIQMAFCLDVSYNKSKYIVFGNIHMSMNLCDSNEIRNPVCSL